MQILVEIFAALIGWLTFRRKHHDDAKSSPAREPTREPGKEPGREPAITLVFVGLFCVAVAGFPCLDNRSAEG